MELSVLREQIDEIDAKMLELFVKRMDVCRNIAEYKRENSLPVLQGGREEQVIKRIRELSPPDIADGSEILFKEIMSISRAVQNREIYSDNVKPLEPKLFLPKMSRVIACPGTVGSNTELAARKLFPTQEIRYYDTFDEVFSAVERKETDFGVIPIQNSTAGTVSETYSTMAKHDFYIASMIKMKIDHCLAAKKGTLITDVTKVLSHPHALSQCSDFIRGKGFLTGNSLNTSIAAKEVCESPEPIACICNRQCAEINGLEVIAEDITDAETNYTRFICIAKNFYATENSKIISVALSIPHTKGSLYQLLTKFAVNGFNLVKIENKPLAGTDFEAIFYMDFEGRFDDIKVCAFMNELERELNYFKFMGNYSEII